MIKLNQVTALFAKLGLHLIHDPGGSITDRMNVRVRPEPGPQGAVEKLLSGNFGPARNGARIDRRFASFGMRQGNLGLFPHQRFPFALVLLAGIRLDNRNHPAIGLRNNILMLARRFRKNRGNLARFEDALGMAKSDPLDRALRDLDAIVLLQLDRHLSKGLIGGEIGDRALQRPRTTPRGNFGAAHERAHAFVPEPILRL